jgi:hypothetical protein
MAPQFINIPVGCLSRLATPTILLTPDLGEAASIGQVSSLFGCSQKEEEHTSQGEVPVRQYVSA